MASSAAISVFESLSKAGLGHLLVSQGDELYEQRVASYWSSCQRLLRPHGFIRPQTTEDVAKVVKVLAGTQAGTFAVRSGGHTTWQGSSSIGEDGITIDLGALNKTTYNTETKLASVQPGASWSSVFAELDKHGVVVAGGREGNVGVGGFTLGGGISWFSPRYGFSCDNVANFEIVLANGDVIEANAESHPDLFQVLKGGSGNFGIVTRFDYVAFSEPSVWGGIRIVDVSSTAQQIDALSSFTTSLEQNPNNAGFAVWAYRPEMFGPGIICLQFIVNTKGEERPKAFDKWLSIPTPVPQMDMTKKLTMATLAKECEQTGGFYASWKNVVFKNDPATINKAVELHEVAVNDLKAKWPTGKIWTMAILQPLPAYYGRLAEERGGNATGFAEQVKEDSILFIAGILVGEQDHFEYADAQCKKWRGDVESYARENGTLTDWLYLNYADYDQDPLPKMGTETVTKIKEAAKKYDPSGFFQTRVPGGIKVFNKTQA